jgi:glutathione reductase (NADPH)
MPPVEKPNHEHYDYVVIGGGSGGSGTSVRPSRLAQGTCV